MANAAPAIGFLLLPQFTLTPFSLLIDVLRLAADEGDRSRPLRFGWTLIAPTLDPVRASCGAAIPPTETLGDPARFDYIVVCGGLLRRPHGHDAAVEAFLRRAADAGKVVIGLCTGSFMLAQAGLLGGRRASVSWFHAAEFRDEFADVSASATGVFLVDGPVVTCAGGTGAADVAAWIIGRHCSEGVAQKALNILQIDSARPINAPQPRPAMAETVRDPRVRRATLLIEERLDRPPTTDQLATALGLSRRQLERLFLAETGMGPAAFASRMRLHYADWMMQTSTASLTAIASLCGFADAAHLSRRYKSAFGQPPSHARAAPDGYATGARRPYRHEP